MSRIERLAKEIKYAGDYTKVVFDLCKNILTIGAIYYISDRFSHALAVCATFFLVGVLITPLCSALLAIILPISWSDNRFSIYSVIIRFVLIGPIMYLLSDSIMNAVSFIAKK